MEGSYKPNFKPGSHYVFWVVRIVQKDLHDKESGRTRLYRSSPALPKTDKYKESEAKYQTKNKILNTPLSI